MQTRPRLMSRRALLRAGGFMPFVIASVSWSAPSNEKVGAFLKSKNASSADWDKFNAVKDVLWTQFDLGAAMPIDENDVLGAALETVAPTLWSNLHCFPDLEAGKTYVGDQFTNGCAFYCGVQARLMVGTAPMIDGSTFLKARQKTEDDTKRLMEKCGNANGPARNKGLGCG